MFNYMQFGSCPNSTEYDDIAKHVWEYLLNLHIQTDPSTDFGSLVKEIRDKLNKEKSRILLE